MSLLATVVQDLRLQANELDRNMVQMGEYGAFDFFMQQTNSPTSIVPEDVRQAAFNSMGMDVSIPVIDYNGGVTVANSRSCTIPDNDNTSKLYKLVWTTLSTGFSIVPSAYSNNSIGLQRDMLRKYQNCARALLEKIDSLAVAALELNKTQVFNNPAYYDKTGNVINVPWLMRESILGDSGAMMRANKYGGQLHVIGNSGIDINVRQLAQSGVYNEKNKRLEFTDKILHYTNSIANESGKFGTGYVVEDGNCAILTRVDRDAARNAKSTGHEWGTVMLPWFDLVLGYHKTDTTGDQSATNGKGTADLTCSPKEYYGFSIDVCFVVAYNSAPATIANPVMKFQIERPVGGVPSANPVFITNDATNPVKTKAV